MVSKYRYIPYPRGSHSLSSSMNSYLVLQEYIVEVIDLGSLWK